jgi:hypothetical protein
MGNLKIRFSHSPIAMSTLGFVMDSGGAEDDDRGEITGWTVQVNPTPSSCESAREPMTAFAEFAYFPGRYLLLAEGHQRNSTIFNDIGGHREPC